MMSRYARISILSLMGPTAAVYVSVSSDLFQVEGGFLAPTAVWYVHVTGPVLAQGLALHVGV